MVFALYDVATYDLACCACNYVHLCDEPVYYIICFNHTLRYHTNIAYVKFFFNYFNVCIKACISTTYKTRGAISA
jgi:hypothetical protein